LLLAALNPPSLSKLSSLADLGLAVFALGRRTKQGRHIAFTLEIGFVGKVGIAKLHLIFNGEGVFETLFCAGTFELRHVKFLEGFNWKIHLQHINEYKSSLVNKRAAYRIVKVRSETGTIPKERDEHAHF
jgi:hypothetical protein